MELLDYIYNSRSTNIPDSQRSGVSDRLDGLKEPKICPQLISQSAIASNDNACTAAKSLLKLKSSNGKSSKSYCDSSMSGFNGGRGSETTRRRLRETLSDASPSVQDKLRLRLRGAFDTTEETGSTVNAVAHDSVGKLVSE